eukprot:CAMPEP_0170616334 /NCGR_PEP_ID=MMETSP0224-20130122/25815_1 /TAXON_ID=285029 /ORGANISM="Togula jolla, Strain CCCM 725" /LENGTH=931 /DNA_ID=CAMNT_0010942125 /DNA_START=43 /DNA_END=2838 /DNA_ORIENTATION=+
MSSAWSVLYGKFRVDGTTDERNYCLVPPCLYGNCNFARKTMQDILKHWKMSPPSLLLLLSSGRINQKNYVDERLIQCGDYQQLLAALDAEEKPLSEQLELANSVLHGYLVQTLDALGSAADQTNSWIVSPAGHGDHPGSAELTLETALRRSGAKPVIFVADYLNRSSWSCIYPKMHQLLKNPAALSPSTDDSDNQKVILPDIWSPTSNFWVEDEAVQTAIVNSFAPDISKDFTLQFREEWDDLDQEELKEHCLAAIFTLGYSLTDLEDYDILDRNGEPLTWAATFKDEIFPLSFKLRNHVSRFLRHGLDCPSFSKGHPWTLFPFRSGTHYLFFDSDEPQDGLHPCERRNFEMLGKVGYVFFGGGSGTRARIKECYCKGIPAILVKNTGRATQQAALVHSMITDPKQIDPGFDSEEKFRAKLVDEEFLWRIAKKIHSTVLAEYDRGPINITVADVLDVLYAYQMRPMLFTKTIKVVNPLSQSPEEILDDLSACFSSTYTGTLELGSSGTANQIIMNAWEQHFIVHSNSVTYHRWGAIFTAIGLVCNLFATSLATLMMITKQHPEHMNALMVNGHWTLMEYAVVLLPALGGLMTTLLNRYSFNHKSGSSTVACAQIVAEIYAYRMRVGAYAPQSITMEADSEEEEEEDASQPSNSAATKGRDQRLHFISTIRTIMLGLSISYQDVTLEMPSRMRLLEHVASTVMPKSYLPVKSAAPKPGEKTPLVQKATRGKGKLSMEGGKSGVDIKDPELGIGSSVDRGAEADDYVEEISTETYLTYRVQPLLSYYYTVGPRLSWWQTALELLVIISATVGTVLSAFGYYSLIPITVAFGGVIVATEHHMRLAGRIVAVNNAISELEDIISLSSALGKMEKRIGSFKSMVVQRTEAAVLGEAVAAAGITQFRKGGTGTDSGDQKPGGKHQTGKAQAGRNSKK